MMPKRNQLFPADHERAVTLLVILGLAMTLSWCCMQGGVNLLDLDAATRVTPDFRLDINQATWSELSQISGIGETLARRIVSHRAAHGPYTQTEDLQDVRGLGPKTLTRLRAYLLPTSPPRLQPAQPQLKAAEVQHTAPHLSGPALPPVTAH